MPSTQTVSWKTYAEKYDMLLAYNPYYQQLQQEVMQEVKKWKIQPGDQIADIGAGTGNYSLAIAQHFPEAIVFHIDNDEGMNAVAAGKKNLAPLPNHRILSSGIEEVNLEVGALRALVSIHALYTFPNPRAALEKMYAWLEPGGQAVLVDAGRIVNVWNWQLALGSHLIRRYGLRKALEIFREGKEVSRQNAYIRNLQKDGTFWTHSHKEFCEAVEKTGFEIQASRTTFRGISDLVVVRKER